MEFKEFSAKTVDEAITKACLDFETSSENLEIQVLFEGSSGFLGFGAKPARINVRRKEVSLPEEPVIEEAVPVKRREKRSTKRKKEKKRKKSSRASREESLRGSRKKMPERQEAFKRM